MRKTVTTIVAAAGVAAAAIVSPQPAEARCLGCWVGAGIAAGIIGGALASRAYGYGYGYGPSYGAYAYAPAYSYAPAYNGGYAPGAYYGGNYGVHRVTTEATRRPHTAATPTHRAVPMYAAIIATRRTYSTRSRNGSRRLELQGRCFAFPRYVLAYAKSVCLPIVGRILMRSL